MILQVVLEFDFRREANVMDAVADNLKVLPDILYAWLSGTHQGCELHTVAFTCTRLKVEADVYGTRLKQGLRKTLEVPRSVGGLVTKRLLVMNFIEGDQITRLAHRTRGLSQRWAIHICACAWVVNPVFVDTLLGSGSKLKSDWPAMCGGKKTKVS